MKKVEKIFIIVGISALVLSIILGITSITMFSSQMAKDINKIDFDEVARRLGSRFDELDFVYEDGHILIEGEDGFRVEVDESGIDVVGVGDEVDDSDDESSHDSDSDSVSDSDSDSDPVNDSEPEEDTEG